MPIADALVKPRWLRTQLMNKVKTLRVLHVGKELDGQALPESVHFNVDLCKDINTPYKHMLPSAAQFSKYVASLGITNENHVIVYDHHDETGTHWAPRIWWMFRVFGHSSVSVLDGGLKRWSFEGYPTVPALKIPQEIPGKNISFKTTPQSHLLKDYDFMLKNISKPPEERCQMIDARSETRFQGKGEECEEDIVQGHILHAKNLPFTEFIDENTKMFKDPYTLKSLFNARGIDLGKPVVTYCGIGVTACFVPLAAKVAGCNSVSVFDGSWCEFGQRAEADGYKSYITTE